ncbi:hypothetical protein F4814DRAFT_436893 [Daldinia grandis]|nr:hypothetical protein F4814DRAFT_436893 [Daldinia grandis]
MSLPSLPPEALSIALEFLVDEDLTSLILARRVCKRFQETIERILFQLPLTKAWDGTSPIGVCPLLLEKFKHLFVNGRREFRPDEGRSTGLPFRHLPWAAERQADGTTVKEVVMKDSPYLRPEASWRRLSVTFGAGPAVRAVDVVKVLTVYGGTSMDCGRLYIPPPSSEISGEDNESVAEDDKGEEGEADEEGEESEEGEEGILTMGLLYDLLASGVGHMGTKTTSWQLLPGSRMGSYKEWQKLRAQSQYPNVERIKELFVKDDESAVLFVTGQRGCTMGGHMKGKIYGEEDRAWEPEAIGDSEIELRPRRRLPKSLPKGV